MIASQRPATPGVSDAAFSAYAALDLRPMSFTPNWPLKNVGPQQFLFLGLGAAVDAVAHALAKEIREAQVPDLRIGTIREVAEAPGVIRTLRIRHTSESVHHAVADLYLRRQGDDLLVKIEPQARSMLKHLKRLVFGGCFLVLWCLAYGLFYSLSGVREGFMREFVHTHYQGHDEARLQLLREQYIRGGDLLHLAGKDPKLALMNLGGPPAMIAAAVAGVIALAPRWLITGSARLVKWPTPSEFDALTTGHVAWVEGVLSAVLLQQFGVHEGQKLSLAG